MFKFQAEPCYRFLLHFSFSLKKFAVLWRGRFFDDPDLLIGFPQHSFSGQTFICSFVLFGEDNTDFCILLVDHFNVLGAES